MPRKHISELIVLVLTSLAAPAVAQGVVSHVADEDTELNAEGILSGHTVQANGGTICDDPYAIGRYISCTPELTIRGETFTASEDNQVWVSTSGYLNGYFVVDADGETICADPRSYPHFRSPTSYIWCE